MLKIVVDDKIPFLKGALEGCARVVYLPGKDISRDAVKDADALIVRTRTRCDAGLLEGSSVKFIATATIGYDHIDTGYCEANGISWTNAPGCNSSSVAQYIASLLLCIASRRKTSLKGLTLGVVGAGNVGSKVVRTARALGMKTLVNDPPRERREGSEGFCGLARILAESDFITLHVPLEHEGDDRTFRLAGSEFFSKAARTPFVVNSSRGEVLDEAALKEAIRSGAVSGAALDVWNCEPDIDRSLLPMLGIATPHIAGYSTDGKVNGTAMSVNSLARRFSITLKEWFPEKVPEPECPSIELDCSGSIEDVLLRAVSASYDIRLDDARLRKSPGSFERQRGDYPLRREFHAFTIRPAGAMSSEIEESLSLLGFKISSK